MRNFRSILEGNIITDLTDDLNKDSQYIDKEKTVIQTLYEEQYKLLQERKLELEDEQVISAFDGTDLSKNPREVVLNSTDHTVFMKQSEIDRIELDKEIAQIAKERAEIDKMKKEVEELLAKTKKESQEIMKKAKIESEQMRKNAQEEGHKNGYDTGNKKGYDEGYTQGKDRLLKENAELMTNGTIAFFNELQFVLKDVEKIQNQLVKSNIDQMKEVSLAVAEKIIQVSLQSSGEVIRKMIVSATDKILDKAWAKIYVSKLDSALLIEMNVDLIKELSYLSPHIKIEVIDNATYGTCIIELPDQMIDASINTQFDKIKDVIDACEYGGGM